MLLANPSRRIACSVITVFGAEVPEGSALTSWITGLFTHWPFYARKGIVAAGAWRAAGGGVDAWRRAVEELHLRQRRQPWPHGQDVGGRADLRWHDAEGPEQLRRGHVDTAGPVGPGGSVLERGVRRFQPDDVAGAKGGGDGVRGGCRCAYLRRAQRCVSTVKPPPP